MNEDSLNGEAHIFIACREKNVCFFLTKFPIGLARFRFVNKLKRMTDPAKLTKDQLLELLKFKSVELQCKEDIIRQLEQKHEDLELAYQKLWHERFSARSERYIADPSQLCLDFGNTDEANDASAGLADAVEEADLIPAHRRRKPRKKRNESLPAHLPALRSGG